MLSVGKFAICQVKSDVDMQAVWHGMGVVVWPRDIVRNNQCIKDAITTVTTDSKYAVRLGFVTVSAAVTTSHAGKSCHHIISRLGHSC